jgi:predicted component of type VI protein secretion system
VIGPGRLTGETSALVFGEHLRHDPKAAAHPLAGHAFFLRAGGDQNEVLLGRAPECDLTIPDASVSERHCKIVLTEEGVAAIDLESRNGTSINLTRLLAGKSELLADEDMLTLGRYSFQVMSSATLHAALTLLDTLASP